MSLQYRLRLGQHYVQCDAYPCDAEYPATGEEYYKSAPDGWVHIETQKLGEEIDIIRSSNKWIMFAATSEMASPTLSVTNVARAGSPPRRATLTGNTSDL